MKKKSNRKAFTLVELLVVIAILAILATVSVVGYTSFIKNAYVSNDNTNAATITRALELYEGGIYSEADLKQAIALYCGSDYLDTMEPESAQYGYHYWYKYNLDTGKGEIVLATAEELAGLSGTDLFKALMLNAYSAPETRPSAFAPESPRTFIDDYYLLDNAGSDLAEYVKMLEDPTMTDAQFAEVIAGANYSNGDTDKILHEALVNKLDDIVIINATGAHTTATDTTTVTNVYIPEAKDDEGYTLGAHDKELGSVTEVNLPANVVVGSDSLTTLPNNATITVTVENKSNDQTLGEYVGSCFDKGAVTVEVNIKVGEEEFKIVVNINSDKDDVIKGDETVGQTNGRSNGVKSFDISIEGVDSEGKYSVALDKVAAEYQMKADNFVSTNESNPTYVSDKSVTWSLVDAPAGVTISDTGVVSGITSAGIFKVKATSNLSPNVTKEYEIRVGVINDVTIDCTYNGETTTVGFDSNNISETITHGYNTTSAMNIYKFSATAGYMYPDVTNHDESYTWAVSDTNIAEITADGVLTIKKAGNFSVTFKYNKYESVARTINFVVTNKVTSFEIGIKDIDTVAPLYSVDLSKANASYEMIIKSVGTDDGGNSLGNKTVLWDVLGDGISNDGNKVSFTKAGEFTVKATIDGVTESFTFRVGGLDSIGVSLNGTPAVFDNNNETDTIVHSLGINDEYTITLNPGYNYTDVMPTLTPKYEVSDETKAIVSGNKLTVIGTGAFSVTVYYVEYPSVKYVLNFNSVASDVFNYENKLDFNYRYGTANAGTILLKDGIDASKYTFELDTSNYNNQGTDDRAMTYKITDGKVMATFVGGGKAEIVAKYDGTEVDRVTIEIVTGAKNVHTGADIVNGSMCLMGDVTSDKAMSIGKNQGLYGNGYTLTATAKPFYSGTTFISLAGTMENVNVVGVEVDNYYTHGDVISGNEDQTDNYKASATVTVSNGAVIDNCMISNGKYAVRSYNQTGTFTIKNTVINGGIFGLKINGGANLTINLENVTIAQLRTQQIIGIGVFFDISSSGGDTNVNVNITGNDNKLQTFITYNDLGKLPSDYKGLFQSMWNDSDTVKFKYTTTYNGKEETFMHFGITAQGVMPTIKYDESNLDGRLDTLTKVIASNNALMLGLDATSQTDADKANNYSTNDYVIDNIGDWLTKANFVCGTYDEIAPVFNNIPSGSIKVEISGSTPATLTEDEIFDGFTATKYGKSLAINYTFTKISGEGTYNGLTFTGAAKYIITYTVVDKFDIDASGVAKEYTYTKELVVDVHYDPPKLEISAGTTAKDFNTSMAVTGSLDTTGVKYMVEAEYKYTSQIIRKEWDTSGYYFSLDYLTINATDMATGLPIAKENITFAIGANKSAEECTNAYSSKVLVAAGENKPGGDTSKSQRVVKVTSVTICVKQSDGQYITQTIKIAFYVKSLSGMDTWG